MLARSMTATVALMALLGSSAGVQAKERKQAMSRRVVEPGESLWRIAQDTGCSVDQLRQANSLAEDDVLKIGKRLTIPGCDGSTLARSVPDYMVQKGDTLSRIARDHKPPSTRFRR
jgi:LysM repeat protein